MDFIHFKSISSHGFKMGPYVPNTLPFKSSRNFFSRWREISIQIGSSTINTYMASSNLLGKKNQKNSNSDNIYTKFNGKKKGKLSTFFNENSFSKPK